MSVNAALHIIKSDNKLTIDARVKILRHITFISNSWNTSTKLNFQTQP